MGVQRMTVPTRLVLKAFLDDPEAERYGFELSQLTGLRSGSLYPLLARLLERGWLAARWERLDPKLHGRPRRRYYRLTEDGLRAARQATSPELLERPRRRLLRLLLSSDELYGRELVHASSLSPSTLYAVLAELDERGWVCSRLEGIDEHREGRRRRRYYRLTSEGKRGARSELVAAG